VFTHLFTWFKCANKTEVGYEVCHYGPLISNGNSRLSNKFYKSVAELLLILLAIRENNLNFVSQYRSQLASPLILHSSLVVLFMKSASILRNTLLFGLFFPLANFAQFKEALMPDVTVPLAPVFASNSGNFILDHAGTTYSVTVWDDQAGLNAGLAWQAGTITGYTTIHPGSLVVDPDVCMVTNNAGQLYALVAYYNASTSQFMLRAFVWSPGIQQFTPLTPEVLTPGTFETSINIDASSDGDFFIVWDQAGFLVQAAFGSAIGAMPPQLTFPGAVFNLESGKSPDVCFFLDNTGFRQVDVAYINTGGYVSMDAYRFDDLLAGAVIPQYLFRSPAADLIYRYPRIDCPAIGFGSQYEFTIVVEDSDNIGTWYIKSFNSNSCCPGITTNIYNDGTSGNSPFNIADVPNTMPVVSYQNNSDGLVVGWNFDNQFGLLAAPGASVARYPVVMSCEKQGTMYPNSYFLNVPPLITFGNQFGLLSVSGRFSASGLYSYHDGTINNIRFKTVPHSLNTPNLRSHESGSSFEAWLQNQLTSELQDGNTVLQTFVYDVTGRTVFSHTGTAPSLLEHWQSLCNGRLVGLCLVNSSSSAGNTYKGLVLFQK
jgi:hypothetical protein